MYATPILLSIALIFFPKADTIAGSSKTEGRGEQGMAFYQFLSRNPSIANSLISKHNQQVIKWINALDDGEFRSRRICVRRPPATTGWRRRSRGRRKSSWWRSSVVGCRRAQRVRSRRGCDGGAAWRHTRWLRRGRGPRWRQVTPIWRQTSRPEHIPRTSKVVEKDIAANGLSLPRSRRAALRLLTPFYIFYIYYLFRISGATTKDNKNNSTASTVQVEANLQEELNVAL